MTAENFASEVQKLLGDSSWHMAMLISGIGKVRLDGTFTAQELRAVADLMDKPE